MKVAIPRETVGGETRVAVIPETVKRFVGKGLEVIVETGAGAAAEFSDALYKDAGARIEKSHDKLLKSGKLILKIQPPRRRRRPFRL